MNLEISFIVPVYNRPKEIDELLQSLIRQTDTLFEVVLVEDGSSEKCNTIADRYKDQLSIHYFFKENSGAGESRNFGMQQASGNYFILLDSDVLLPEHYVSEVKKALKSNFTEAFGGPDAAHQSFTPLQKAINYSMTSVLTTGGIRGKNKSVGTFQPRSFNFGLSRVAFNQTGGFSNLKTGEDIDLCFRLWEQGFSTPLIEKAFVYHKRRSSIREFFYQTFGFGTARPLLTQRFPKTAKITYWFPSLFIMGLELSIWFAIFGFWPLLYFYAAYLTLIFFDSLFQNKSVYVAFLSIFTSLTQFLGYGLGFLTSIFCKK